MDRPANEQMVLNKLGIGVTVVTALGGNVKISDAAQNAKDAAKSLKV